VYKFTVNKTHTILESIQWMFNYWSTVSFHKRQNQLMSLNERQSLSKLTVVRATAELICQPLGPILTQWNKSQKLKSWRLSSWNSRLMYLISGLSQCLVFQMGEKKGSQAFTTQYTCPHLFTPGQKQISFETLCAV